MPTLTKALAGRSRECFSHRSFDSEFCGFCEFCEICGMARHVAHGSSICAGEPLNATQQS